MRLRAAPAVALLACLAAGCATAPRVVLSPEPAGHAWWLRTHFEPAGRHVRGIAAGTVDPAWCAIDELTPAHFQAFGRAEGRDPAAPGAPRYALDGPVVDGGATRVLLAVFRRCDGATGTALLLLGAEARGGWRLLAARPLGSPAHYAMLDGGAGDHVRVVRCQDCDDIEELAWDAASRRFIEVPTPDGEP